jgi:uncharacterized protein YjbJ (UPF0337 family)
MSWDRVAGNWKQWRGRIQERWGKLTDDQLDVVAGRRDQLAGRIQEAYGIGKEEVEHQLRNWEQVFDEEPQSTNINGRK